MPIKPGRIFALFYFLIYAFIYTGWLFHESSHPVIFYYTKSYAIFLFIMLFGFALPFLVKLIPVRTKAFIFSIIPATFLILFVYIASSIHYSWSQIHPFDPYLQANPKRFSQAEEKGPGTVRILFLGGSTTEGESLAPQDRYPEIVKALLSKAYPSLKIEIINAGTAWYTTKHSLITYTSYYRAWKPDFVIIMHAMNDLYRSFSPPNYAMGEYDELWNHFYGPSIRGAQPPPFEVHLAEKIYSFSIGSFSVKKISDAWYSKLINHEMDYPVSRYYSLEKYPVYLDTLLDFIEHDGAKAIVVSEPSLYKTGLTPEESDILKFNREVCVAKQRFFYREYASVQSLLEAMTAFNSTAKTIAEKRGALFVDANAFVPKDLQHFTDDVHHSSEGARKVAQTVAESINEKQLLKPFTELS